jgi:hypothetical protein
VHGLKNCPAVDSVLCHVFIAAELYTSDKNGSDESGDGSEAKPFRTILQAMRHAGKEPFPVIYVDAKEEGQVNKL